MIEAKAIEMVPLTAIKLNPKNRNKHPPEQIARLIEIITYQGFRRPVTISNRSGFLSCGEGRYLAAKEMGLKEIPAMRQDYATEEQEYADGIADNAIDKWAELDKSLILQDTLELGPDFNFDMLGMKDFMLPEDFDPQADEDAVPEHVEPKTKLGDLYQLGSHRLLCGDSTDVLKVEQLMGGEKADMVFTDPPYGIDLDTDYSDMAPKSQKHKKVLNDDKDFEPGHLFLFGAEEMFLWGANYYAKKLPDGGSLCVWDKYPTDQNDKRYGSAFELVWSKNKHKQSICRLGSLNVGHHKREAIVHPTQKPVNVVEWFFERWGKTGDSVVDCYGGSGSTLIACEKTKRKCFMMELDPHYCDVIVKRWEDYTGKKAELVNGNS